MKMMLSHTRHRQAMGEGGFTIVELLVAVIILIFVSVALLQTALINIEFNAKNAMRDEGVRVAGETITAMRTAGISNVITLFHDKEVTEERRVRNMTQRPYTVYTTVETVGATTGQTQLYVLVSWQWKDEIFNTTMSTIR